MTTDNNRSTQVENCEICKGITNEGNFCSLCGENLRNKRYTVRDVLADLPNAVFNFDKILFNTFRTLAIHPE